MTANIFKAERDALAFLGLMSNMFQNFDDQFQAPDGERSHTSGLNIHALIIDNATGQVLGMQQNRIHQANNPLLHAEQLTLKEAIERKNAQNPRDPATTSVEGYYRNLLFNDPNSYDALKTGATIYTTLEPCPLCTSALLVSRMKRIVFITPDNAYGDSFYSLWSTFYKKYDIRYEQFALRSIQESTIVTTANKYSKGIMEKIIQMKDVPGTLFFDSLKTELKAITEYFQALLPDELVTKGAELKNNATLLEELQARVY
jgi:tRNA(Arg) A34 adenosine deaminase TadA